MSQANLSMVGIVVIGRNEGSRLVRALDSVAREAPTGTPVVYVDSGSTDGSVEMARGRGCVVVELDLSIPFTAARARNEGAAALKDRVSSDGAFFFMDGDCVLVSGFIQTAMSFLQANPGAAVACGRRRELEPRKNLYHRMAEMEWNTTPGVVGECGGDALMRREPFEAVGGFDPTVIAGEEPELCARLRAAGHTIHRLDMDMTLHDVAMSRFGQWWSRSVRAGYAYILGATSKTGGIGGRWVRNALRVWIWAMIIPVVIAALMIFLSPWAGVLFLVYAKPLYGAFAARRRRGDSAGDSLAYSVMCLLGKFAELQGHFRYLLSRATGRRQKIIEYKTAATTRPTT